MSSLDAKLDIFWQDTSSIKHPFDRSRSLNRLFGKLSHPFYKSSIKHPFGITRKHGLDFMTANLLRPIFTNAKHSLPTNENQQLKLLCLALE